MKIWMNFKWASCHAFGDMKHIKCSSIAIIARFPVNIFWFKIWWIIYDAAMISVSIALEWHFFFDMLLFLCDLKTSKKPTECFSIWWNKSHVHQQHFQSINWNISVFKPKKKIKINFIVVKTSEHEKAQPIYIYL